MRLYSRNGAAAVDDGGKHYEPGKDGGFDFPDDVAERLHGFATAGTPLWETHVERQRREMAEELERRKDPATLLDAVEKIRQAAESMTPGDSEPAKPMRTRRTAASK